MGKNQVHSKSGILIMKIYITPNITGNWQPGVVFLHGVKSYRTVEPVFSRV